MVGLPNDNSLLPVMREIEAQSDRGCGIVAAAFIDDTLTEALKSRLRVQTRIEAKTFQSLTRIAGPLGAFSSKIELGLLIGVYRQEIHRDLHRVRDIRNAFAHRKELRDFKTQNIKDMCDAFWINRNLFFVDTHASHPIPKAARGRFVHAVKLLLGHLQSSIQMPRIPPKAVWAGQIEPD